MGASTSKLLAYSFESKISFGGDIGKLEVFDHKLSPSHTLTVDAISYWLREEGLLNPRYFNPGTGQPDPGRLTISKGVNLNGAHNVDIFLINARANEYYKPVYVVKAFYMGGKQELHDLQKVNELVSRINWKDKFFHYEDLPKLALMENALAYVDDHERHYVIMLLHAAQGIQCSQLVKRFPFSDQTEAIEFSMHLGLAFGAMHAAFLQNDPQKGWAGAITLVHGDAHAGNIFYDKTKSKHQITLIDNSWLEFGPPACDISKCMQRCVWLDALNRIERAEYICRHVKASEWMEDFKLSPAQLEEKKIQYEKEKIAFQNALKPIRAFIEGYVTYFPAAARPVIQQDLIRRYYETLVDEWNRRCGVFPEAGDSQAP